MRVWKSETLMRDVSTSCLPASEISNAVFRAVVFSALGVVPFDPKPGASCAMDWAEELYCANVAQEKYARADLWWTGGHPRPLLFL